MVNRRLLFKAILGAISILIFNASVLAAYPEKPIWWVVPYPAGGSADVVSRIITKRLSERLKQTIVVDNKAGATGALGATFVARAPADGYTVLYQGFDLAINPLVRSLPFDPLTHLTPVTQVANLWDIVVAAKDAPYDTFPEFVAWARKNPEKVNFGTTGAGSAGHLTGELFKKESKLEMVHIPFKGGGPGVIAAIGGQVSIYYATAGSGMPYVQSGQLKPLVVSAPIRMAALPNVPTFTELGYPVVSSEWTGVLVPQGTPPDIVQLLNSEIRAVLAEPAVAEQLAKMGVDVVTSSPQEFSRFLQSETARWGKVVKELNLKYD